MNDVPVSATLAFLQTPLPFILPAKNYFCWMKLYIVLTILSLCISCRDTVKENATTTGTSDTTRTEEKKNYFPVSDYIKSEIAYVDSLPLRIVRYTIQHGKKDSVFLKPAEFDQLAQQFLDPAMEKANFEKNFSETSFMDQTSQSVTFTYSKKEDQPGLRRIDILASPDAVSDKVKSIYLEKTVLIHDSTFIQKMYWKSRKNFQVITISPSGQQPVSQLKVVWDDRN